MPGAAARYHGCGEDTMTDKQWYFNTKTEQPELGMLSPSSHRMGPYKTREDALEAWKIVKERNALWAEANRKWRKWGENTPSDGRDDGFDDRDD
ncbi:hypothetical protein DXC37_09665 [Bifidobacterium bifidum]|uniref:Uncharacterized protein n=2 Tax=Bifidobacterium bifidum TaxID=1681 RepID=A0A133KQ92_BIFBI|nr:hypothetical protein HMPREF3196_00799 [Bifidobacterium bifidum]MBD9131023.1 hypothetical protein [Bifidobacterium bifidum]MBD9133108.1 hypothetical protein [Bifidobacterium bifidum]MBD9265596.1 hypothetical protein [Bifidobacterium bifidum]RGJ38465.1 hypothetical protein DXD62_07605 [Bifidobacterium bifidum]